MKFLIINNSYIIFCVISSNKNQDVYPIKFWKVKKNLTASYNELLSKTVSITEICGYPKNSGKRGIPAPLSERVSPNLIEINSY